MSHTTGNRSSERILLVVALIYLLSPVDLLPGVLIDDIIVIVLSALAQRSRERLESGVTEAEF